MCVVRRLVRPTRRVPRRVRLLLPTAMRRLISTLWPLSIKEASSTNWVSCTALSLEGEGDSLHFLKSNPQIKCPRGDFYYSRIVLGTKGFSEIRGPSENVQNPRSHFICKIQWNHIQYFWNHISVLYGR